MIPVPFRFETLGASHDRAAFCSGDDALDRYLQTQVTQDIRRRIANCFVVVEVATGHIAAYYTLSAASIPLVDLPPDETRRLPRYPTLPAVRIGRLAVDRRFQRRGLGELMLMNAVHRTIQDAAAAFALLVVAKNDLGDGILSALRVPSHRGQAQDLVSTPRDSPKDFSLRKGGLWGLLTGVGKNCQFC